MKINKCSSVFRFFAVLGLGVVCSLSACKNLSSEAPRTGSASLDKPDRELNFAIWGAYITPEIIADFEKQSGIKVQVSNYASNEELLAKLQAGASGYDVAVPSDYMVKVMVELNLLEELQKAKIPNSKQLDSQMLGKYYDAENRYSLPWSSGTTGIAVNTKLVKTEVRGWRDLFESKELIGKFTLLDDVRETLGAALKMEALSLNSKVSTELSKAKSDLIKAKRRVKGFVSETQPGLLNGEMAVAHAYSCDALQAQMKTKGQIKYVLPVEGFTLWIDNLVIPKGAEHPEAAHQFVNYLLSAKVGAARAQFVWSAPANRESLALLPQEIRENKALFPDSAALAKAEMIEDLGENLVEWDRIWTEVKASR